MMLVNNSKDDVVCTITSGPTGQTGTPGSQGYPQGIANPSGTIAVSGASTSHYAVVSSGPYSVSYGSSGGSTMSGLEEKVTASESVYAFAAWLSARNRTLVCGANHSYFEIEALADEFVQIQGFDEPRISIFPENMKEMPVGEPEFRTAIAIAIDQVRP